MAGYSGTALAKKLMIKGGHRVGLFGVPSDFGDGWLGPLPDGVTVSTVARGTFDVVVSFHTERAELERRIPTLLKVLAVDGGLWMAWPKKASKRPTDLTEDVQREVWLPLGLVDTKVCAIDDVWSGLRVCWRAGRRAELRDARASGRR